jgi:hypothetical protein
MDMWCLAAQYMWHHLQPYPASPAALRQLLCLRRCWPGRASPSHIIPSTLRYRRCLPHTFPIFSPPGEGHVFEGEAVGEATATSVSAHRAAVTKLCNPPTPTLQCLGSALCRWAIWTIHLLNISSMAQVLGDCPSSIAVCAKKNLPVLSVPII